MADGARPTEQSRWPAWGLPALVTLLAGLLRLTRLDELGLRIDEGFTLTYARQPWRGVLGLDGFYSPHPPLFFALAKLADLVVPEEVAARSVAAVAGTATIPVAYALVVRLLDHRVALASSLLLALSPLHIQLSRDGRMYAPVVLLVVVSYLALVASWQSPRRAWLVVYAASLALAVYVDYSAAFALAPQLVLLGWLARRDPRRVRGLAIAGGVAVVTYLPWIPQVVATIDRSSNATGRADYLAADRGRITTAVSELFGLNGRATWRAGGSPGPWDRWEDARPLLLLALIPVGVAGIVALRRHALPLVVAALLTIGPPLVAIAASQVSPSFAARTVMTSLVGWSILTGAVFVRGRLPRAVRVVGALGWSYLVVISLLTLPATYREGRREQWREVSAQLVSQSHLDKPVLVFSTAGMLTDMIDLYAGERLAGTRFLTLLDGERESWTGADRWLPRGMTVAQIEAGALASILTPGEPRVDALWMIRRFGGEEVDGPLGRLGYRPVTVIRLVDIELELWARSGADLGDPIAVGGFGEGGDWRFGGDVARLAVRGPVDAAVRLDEDRARGVVTRAAVPGLYTADSQVRVGPGGSGRLSLKCHDASGAVLGLTTSTAHYDPVTRDARRIIWAAVVCPEGTASVDVIVDRRGVGSVEFLPVRLQASPPGVPRG